MIGKYIITRHFIVVDSFSTKPCLEHCLCLPFKGANPGILLGKDKADLRLPQNCPAQLCSRHSPTHRTGTFHAKMKLSPSRQTIQRHKSTARFPERRWTLGAATWVWVQALPPSSMMLGKWLHLSGQQFSHMLERKKAFVSGPVKQTPTGPNLSAVNKTLDNFFLILFCLTESTGK